MIEKTQDKQLRLCNFEPPSPLKIFEDWFSFSNKANYQNENQSSKIFKGEVLVWPYQRWTCEDKPYQSDITALGLRKYYYYY